MVRELSQAIVAAKELLGDELDLRYRVNKFRDDETLVIYRSAMEYVNEGLLPKFEVSHSIARIRIGRELV
jgi:hypothetical protein